MSLALVKFWGNSGDTILNRCLVLESLLFSAYGQTRASRHERTGRPLGGDGFLSRLEPALGRSVRHGKPGPKASATAPAR